MRFLSCLFLIFFSFSMVAQTASKEEQLASLNNYVYFTNESVHGLLIVHRLLENFNQKINKYVDLESNQFNFYSNKDLPRNLFDDPEQWFYDVSPYAWYELSITESTKLPSGLATSLNKDLEQLKSIITRVNAIRFELGVLTESKDLQERKNLDKIYSKLEECVTLYDNFNTIKEELKLKLIQGHQQLGFGETPKSKSVEALHENIRAFLAALKKGDPALLPELSQHLSNNIATAKQTIGNQPLISKANTLLGITKKIVSDGSFPQEYQQYGKAYYFYNIEMVSKTNRYGSGLIVDMNDYTKRTNEPALLLMEEPHFFKVIYPKKKVKVDKVETIASSGKLPNNVKGRQVIMRQNAIELNEPTFLLEISDHQLEDGDIVSINFNDRWILKEYTLKRKPLKVQLQLKPNRVNYLLLHAENIGTKPPNTAKIAYIYKGEKQVVLLSSDDQESEMIELKLGN